MELSIQKELDDVLKQIIAEWEIPGMAVAIVDEHGPVFESYYGFQNIQTGTKISEKSQFCIASVSKIFVALEIMKMHSENLIDINDLAIKYLPDFSMLDSNYEKITIRMILCHKSGIPDLSDLEYDLLLSNLVFDDDALIKHVAKVRQMKLLFEPDEQFSYSNIGYDLLGRIIEVVRGVSFEEAMKNDLLLPLQMHNSTFLFGEVDTERVAWPHLRSPQMIPSPKYPYNRGDSPASFLHSTLHDMISLAKFCIAKGSVNGEQWLLESLFLEMTIPTASRGYPPFYESAGLGWTIGHYHDELVLSHGGMGFGWNDFFMVFPNKKMAAIILVNEESFSRARIIRAVGDAILGIKPQQGSLSWVLNVNRAYVSGGKGEMIDAIRNLQKTQPLNVIIDIDDLTNVFFQIYYSGKCETALDYLDAIHKCFPESTEIKDIKNELSGWIK